MDEDEEIFYCDNCGQEMFFDEGLCDDCEEEEHLEEEHWAGQEYAGEVAKFLKNQSPDFQEGFWDSIEGA